MGIPDAVWNYIGDDKIQKMLCLAMNDSGERFFVYEDITGSCWSSKRVYKFYMNMVSTNGLGINTTMESESAHLCSAMEVEGKSNCRVAFGPNGRYCAWTPFNNWRAWYLPAHVEKVLQATSRLDNASLGVDYAYFFLQKDGKFWYDLEDNYDALEEVMKDLRNGDIVVGDGALQLP